VADITEELLIQSDEPLGGRLSAPGNSVRWFSRSYVPARTGPLSGVHKGEKWGSEESCFSFTVRMYWSFPSAR